MEKQIDRKILEQEAYSIRSLYSEYSGLALKDKCNKCIDDRIKLNPSKAQYWSQVRKYLYV